jgi:murein DD-endopeptidase MepM/ murein hydrolase activator NlpD
MPAPARLLAILLAVVVLPAGPAVAATGWEPPLAGEPAVLRDFRAPAQRWSPGHRGVDLAAAPGQVVTAPAAGVVAYAGVVVDRGVLAIAHAGGLRTSYEPVAALVAAGQPVRRGQAVARVTGGPGHCAPAVCLHWGARRDGTYVDPLTLLRPPEPPVLLPLERAAAAPAWRARPR